MFEPYVGTKVFVSARELTALQMIWRYSPKDPRGKPVEPTHVVLVQELAKKYDLPDLPDHHYGFDPNTGEFLAPSEWEKIAAKQPS